MTISSITFYDLQKSMHQGNCEDSENTKGMIAARQLVADLH
jgi:hypothetical protein